MMTKGWKICPVHTPQENASNDFHPHVSRRRNLKTQQSPVISNMCLRKLGYRIPKISNNFRRCTEICKEALRFLKTFEEDPMMFHIKWFPSTRVTPDEFKNPTITVISNVCLRKTAVGKSHDYRVYIVEKPRIKMFLSTRKRKAGIFNFIQLEGSLEKLYDGLRLNPAHCEPCLTEFFYVDIISKVILV